MGGLVALLVLVGLGVAGMAWLGDDDPDPVAQPTAEPSPDATVAPSPMPSPAPTTPPDQGSEPSESGSANPLDGLEDLLGEGGLEDLLGEGGLDDLLGGGGGGIDQELLACLTPEGVQPSLQGTPLPDDPAEAIRAIGDQVAELRALEFADQVELDLLSSDELADRVVELTEEDYLVEDSDVDQAILTALGQIGPDLDLRQTYLDLLGEQVAGFYDPETGELVAQSGGDLPPTDRIIVAHELDHALTDQDLGLPDLEGQDDIDALLARQGLVEGDATVLMQQWAAAHLSLTDQLSLAVPQADTQALEDAPYVLQQQLLYPYEDGLAFVCSQYNDDGWAAVDDMYTDLPTTTAQVLFPDRYDAGEEAVEVAPMSLPGATELRSTTWGAADLLWLLSAPGDDPDRGPEDARERARAWAGGRLIAWDGDGRTTVAVRLAEHADAPTPLCQSLEQWSADAFPDATDANASGDERRAWEGGGQAGTLSCADGVATVVVGPDLPTVRGVEG